MWFISCLCIYVYRSNGRCSAFVISMRIVKATDLKLITAAILLLILIISDSMKRKGAHHA